MFLDEPPPSDLSAQLYQEDRDSGGYVDNLTRLWSWRPDAMVAFYDARAVLLDGSGLSPVDVAVITQQLPAPGPTPTVRWRGGRSSRTRRTPRHRPGCCPVRSTTWTSALPR
jgi:hypothetical protein